jgi:hypothetical protein
MSRQYGFRGKAYNSSQPPDLQGISPDQPATKSKHEFPRVLPVIALKIPIGVEGVRVGEQRFIATHSPVNIAELKAVEDHDACLTRCLQTRATLWECTSLGTHRLPLACVAGLDQASERQDQG